MKEKAVFPFLKRRNERLENVRPFQDFDCKLEITGR